MALTKKITKAVQDAQKQATDAVADMREQLDVALPEVHVDLTPFYAVVGAASMAVDTVTAAGEQLEEAAKQATSKDLRKEVRKGAKKEMADLQKRITELQQRTAELQDLATKFADRFVQQAQDIPARVLNEGLVMASNAKDRYDAAAARGEKVVTDLRVQEEKLARDLAGRSGAAVTRGRKAAQQAVTETGKVAETLRDVVSDDAAKVSSQLDKSVEAVEHAAEPVAVKKTPAQQARARKAAAEKAAATRKANAAEATATRKIAARSAAARRSPAAKSASAEKAAATTAKKAAPAKKAPAKKAPAKKAVAKKA
jgi:hypothetical protein